MAGIYVTARGSVAPWDEEIRGAERARPWCTIFVTSRSHCFFLYIALVSFDLFSLQVLSRCKVEGTEPTSKAVRWSPLHRRFVPCEGPSSGPVGCMRCPTTRCHCIPVDKRVMKSGSVLSLVFGPSSEDECLNWSSYNNETEGMPAEAVLFFLSTAAASHFFLHECIARNTNRPWMTQRMLVQRHQPTDQVSACVLVKLSIKTRAP